VHLGNRPWLLQNMRRRSLHDITDGLTSKSKLALFDTVGYTRQFERGLQAIWEVRDGQSRMHKALSGAELEPEARLERRSEVSVRNYHVLIGTEKRLEDRWNEHMG
jgi:hypothetical protein